MTAHRHRAEEIDVLDPTEPGTKRLKDWCQCGASREVVVRGLQHECGAWNDEEPFTEGGEHEAADEGTGA